MPLAPEDAPGGARRRRVSRAKRAERGERRGLPRWALPAMGAAATVLVALLVAGSALRDDSTTGVTQTLSGGDTAATSEAAPQRPRRSRTPPARAGASADEDAARSSKQAAPGTALPDAGRRTAPDTLRRERKVERGVELTLRVGAGQLEEAADGVVRTTQRLGGYVADSQVVRARRRGGSASFTLRDPDQAPGRGDQPALKARPHRRAWTSPAATSRARSSPPRSSSPTRAPSARRCCARSRKATTPGHIASLRARIRAQPLRDRPAQGPARRAAPPRRPRDDQRRGRRARQGLGRRPAATATGRPATPPGTPCACSRSPPASLLIALAVLVPLALLGRAGAARRAARHAGAGAKVPWTPPDRRRTTPRGNTGVTGERRAARPGPGLRGARPERPRARRRGRGPAALRRRPRHLPRGRRLATRATSCAPATPARSASTPTAARSRSRTSAPATSSASWRCSTTSGARRRSRRSTTSRRSRSSARDMRRLLQSTPTSPSSSSIALGRRLREANERLARQSFQTVQSRVAGVLGQLVAQAQAEGARRRATCSSRSPRPTSPSSPAPRASRPAASSRCSSAPASITQGRGRITVHDPTRWRGTSTRFRPHGGTGVLRGRRGRPRRRVRR